MKNEHIKDGPLDSVGYFHMRFVSGLEVLAHVIRHDEYTKQTSPDTLLMFRPVKIIETPSIKVRDSVLAPFSIFSNESCVPFTTDDLEAMLPMNSESVIKYLDFLELNDLDKIDNAFDLLIETRVL